MIGSPMSCGPLPPMMGLFSNATPMFGPAGTAVDVGDLRTRRLAAREALGFCGLAYGLTWGPHLALVALRGDFSLGSRLPATLYGAGFAGPSLAAWLMSRRHHDSVPRTVRVTTTPGAVAGALVAQPIVTLVAAGLARSAPTFHTMNRAMLAGQLWVAPNEEIGWRGYLVPRLRAALSTPAAVLVTAAIWGGWHLPMFFVTGSPQQEDDPRQFASAILAWTAVHHLLQVRHPSITTAAVLHAATNITVSTVSLDRKPSRLTATYIVTAALVTFVADRFQGLNSTRSTSPQRVLR